MRDIFHSRIKVPTVKYVDRTGTDWMGHRTTDSSQQSNTAQLDWSHWSPASKRGKCDAGDQAGSNSHDGFIIGYDNRARDRYGHGLGTAFESRVNRTGTVWMGHRTKDSSQQANTGQQLI